MKGFTARGHRTSVFYSYRLAKKSFSFQDSSRMENYKNDANHISFAFLNIMSEKELSVIINTEFNGNSRLVLLQMGTLGNC